MVIDITEGTGKYVLILCPVQANCDALVSFVCFVFTARNSSYGKVMFSQACVKNSVHKREHMRGTHAPPPCPGTHTLDTHTCPPGHTCPPRARTPPGHACPPGHARPQRILRDAVNEQAVRILLECILVKILDGSDIICLPLVM